jgi:hypothetical protein
MANQKDAVYAALQDFIQNNEKDPKAAIIFLFIGGMYQIMQVYDGLKPPKGAFGKFEDIPAILDFGKTMPYTDIVRSTLELVSKKS